MAFDENLFSKKKKEIPFTNRMTSLIVNELQIPNLRNLMSHVV